MPFLIVRNDITRMQVDAIVNAAKPSLLGGGGVDGMIHAAAGRGLTEECRTLGGCERGEAKITRGYNLPCRYVIHTVGPIWNGGGNGERAVLRSCYRSSLELAELYGCSSVAFPLISAGIYGYPKREAMTVASEEIRAFLTHSDMTVYLVIFGSESNIISRELFSDIREYIDDHYTERYSFLNDRRNRPRIESAMAPMCAPKPSMPDDEDTHPGDFVPDFDDFDDFEPVLDESFQQMLLRKIDERGITDAQCYNKANIDRKLFSKIRGDVHYKPSKKTALSLAIALELSLSDTNELLNKAGYALSHSVLFDVIIEYFIVRGNYDIFTINEALFSYDQPLLGC